MSVILINKSKRMKVYNLDTTALVGLRGKKVTMHKIVESRDGTRRPARIQKMICGSLTLCSGEKTGKFPDGTPLPKEILKVPAIAADIARGLLRVGIVEAPAAGVKTKTRRIVTSKSERSSK